MDTCDTIAAIGTTASGAARGMIRISGPAVLQCLSKCFDPDKKKQCLAEIDVPSVVQGSIRISGHSAKVPCELFHWPSQRSYTRQPAAELHTIGSPPLLEAVMQSVCQSGARPAEPGEFTLRAFLAGRLDLTQAEAVLGVINARGQHDLDAALAQLAGGLSVPLLKLREQLLQILAELEAGLDFADEDLEFVSQDDLCRVLTEAKQTVLATLQQMDCRTETTDLPRVVLTGAPNVGKSSLFNALVDSSVSDALTSRSIVSSRSGTTRDYVTAVVDLDGTVCELVDTAGRDDSVLADSIDHAAQHMANKQQEQATLEVLCLEATEAARVVCRPEEFQLVVLTKADLAAALVAENWVIACSSLTGAGIVAVREQIRQRIEQLALREGNSVSITAARCAESLHHAKGSLERAIKLCTQVGVEELVAAEVRLALLDLGRVVGTVYTDDVLDRIFSQFCIGK